jgi:cytochrome c553
MPVCSLLGWAGRSLQGAEVDYNRDVKPLLQQHCTGCHGVKRQRGDLRLDSRAALLKGGSRGPAVVAGKSAESLLIRAVTQEDPEIAMPPEGEPLSAGAIQVLRDWIDQGAEGPADEVVGRRELPWSFRPVQRPELPSSPASIDALLEAQRARQDLAGLGFSSEADRVTQIRRLYLVMHGLPPTPAEVEEFRQDTLPGAYERLVERVLASPRYGERWARHWLDIARFAESNGFETNRVRANAWPYRDYVIEAFNTDKPYDQFVREQVAGDALRADAGTGFLVAGAYDLVKSPDINLSLMQRQDELADIINTTGTAFLGLTLGCARCHDHKFDPVSQRDYYALQGVFAGVNFAPRPLRRGGGPPG